MFARLCIVFLLAGSSVGCADQWLLYPSTVPMSARGAQQRFIVHDDRRVEVFISRSPAADRTGKPDAYSLEFVGNSMRAEQVADSSAQMWGERSVEIWSVNYPGFGKSDGPPKLDRIPEAALVACDALLKVANGKPILLKGFSMGTTAALYVAANRPVAGIILQSPPPLQREIMQRFGWCNLWMVASVTALEVPGELNALCTAPRVKVPGVFILSGADTVVPRKYQMMVVDHFAGPKQIMVRENTDHGVPLPPDDPVLQQKLDWLWKSTVETPASQAKMR